MPSDAGRASRADPRGRAAVALAVAALTALALVARLVGLGAMLPHLPEPDGHIVRQVELLGGALADPSADLNWGKYPHGIAHVARLAGPPGAAAAAPAPEDLEGHLRRAAAPFRHVRGVVAWLSVVAVPALFLLARRFVAPPAALLAAYWMATSVLHVSFSQQARPHAPGTALILLAVAACVELRRRGDAAGFAAAGLACGAAIACLQSGVATLLPLAPAVVTREGPRRPPVWALALLPAAAVAGAFALCWPFLGGAGGGARSRELTIRADGIRQAGHVFPFGPFTDGGFERTLHAFWSYEPLALALGALGIALWIASRARAASAAGGAARIAADARSRDFWVVLAFVVPYVLLAAAYRRTYGRLVMPLLPFLYIAAAWAVERLWARCATAGGAARFLRGALAAAVVGLPAAVALQHAAVRARPDTATEAARWLERHLDPAGAVVARPRTIGLPLATAPAVRAENAGYLRTDIASWLGYQLAHPAVDAVATPWNLPYLPLATARQVLRARARPDRFVDRLDATHVLIADYEEYRRDPALTAIYAELQGRAELVARWSPYREGVAERLPLAYQDAPIWRQPYYTLRVLRARTQGPVLELYRLPPAR